MPDPDGTLEAAGLPSRRSKHGARASRRTTAYLEAASAASCAHLFHGEELLGRLPVRPDRNEAEVEAAAFLNVTLDAARSRFLRVHAEAVYATLTDDLRRAVRDEDLVYAAADRFPGLVPTRTQMASERTGPGRQGGHRDRAGPVPLVRARVAA